LYLSSGSENEPFHTVSFRYYANNTPNIGVDEGAFSVIWLDKDIYDTTPEAAFNINEDPTVSYNTKTGDGVISFQAASVDNDVKKHSTLRLISKKEGMYRDVEIYSIGYVFSPSLTKTGSQYRLTFSLPPGLPQELFLLSPGIHYPEAVAEMAKCVYPDLK